MKKLSIVSRLTLSLVALALTVLMALRLTGVLPTQQEAMIRQRMDLTERLSFSLSLVHNPADPQLMQTTLDAARLKYPNIQSIAIRDRHRRLVASSGPHQKLWQPQKFKHEAGWQAAYPLGRSHPPSGRLEVVFEPLDSAFLLAEYDHPVTWMALIAALGLTVVFYFYCSEAILHRIPGALVPQHVESAFDQVSEALMLLDSEGRIVHANSSFSSACGKPLEKLVGEKADALPWQDPQRQDASTSNSSDLPWRQAQEDGQDSENRILKINDRRETHYVVNSMAITDEDGRNQGTLTSFEQVAHLQRKRDELARMLEVVSESAEQVRQQNKELEKQAICDPLTGCFNRRHLFEQFERLWAELPRRHDVLSCVMVDVDHFKLINDQHGHVTGDQVLSQVGECLNRFSSDNLFVARYGGEEFALLLSHTSMHQALIVAEQIRMALSQLRIGDLSITASLGISDTSQGAGTPHDLIEQADQALYLAKRSGRNRTVLYDDATEATDETVESAEPTVPDESPAIPYPAVTALVSALSSRDRITAAHCRRVADLCTATGLKMISLRSCHVLETAALLHDIGKIGVPDSILLKPTSLTSSEYEQIRQADRIGLDIIQASFGSEELSEIVKNYRVRFSDASKSARPPSLSARILAVADAYDAMTTPRVYRQPLSATDAFAELRACVGSQFDPTVVEHFIEVVQLKNRQEASLPKVPKTIALEIGLEIERLAVAVDARDLSRLKLMAGRLAATATRNEAPEIASQAAQLEQVLEEDADLIQILLCAGQLLELCRSTQAAILESPEYEPTSAAATGELASLPL